jgi:hypothetical protein
VLKFPSIHLPLHLKPLKKKTKPFQKLNLKTATKVNKDKRRRNICRRPGLPPWLPKSPDLRGSPSPYIYSYKHSLIYTPVERFSTCDIFLIIK